LAVDFSSIAITPLHKRAIWQRADRARNRHWDGKLPVNVDLIAEKVYGVQFIPINDLKRLVETEAFLTGTLDEIDYDLSSPDVRIRFSIAHELGHKDLHPEQIKALRSASFTEWKAVLANIPGGIWGTAEWQAREFAGRLLVPREQLIEAIRTIKPLIDEARRTVPKLQIPALSEYIAPLISKRFNVSDIVIKTRLDVEEINPLKV
jgi:hypothetical protein